MAVLPLGAGAKAAPLASSSRGIGAGSRAGPLESRGPLRYSARMSTRRVLDREEYVEQAYFFRILRERLAASIAIQELLASLDQEILSTTRLPLAVQFLTAEVKHTGLLSSGFTRLAHYFTPFQALVVRGTEDERNR